MYVLFSHHENFQDLSAHTCLACFASAKLQRHVQVLSFLEDVRNHLLVSSVCIKLHQVVVIPIPPRRTLVPMCSKVDSWCKSCLL